MVTYLCHRYQVSARRACRTRQCVRATYQYRSRRDPRTALRQCMWELTQTRVRYGYGKILVLLKREAWNLGKKLVYRLYQEEGLVWRPCSLRRHKAVVSRREPMHLTRPNAVWSLDFVADQLADGRRVRALTVVDVLTRECLAMKAGQSLRGEHVVAALKQIKTHRGSPKKLFCEHGSEFTSPLMDLWAYQNQVKIDFSRPGKPTDKAFIESFNGTLQREGLNTQWFLSLKDATQQLEAWRQEYKRSRPHRALHNRTPEEFAKNHAVKESRKEDQPARELIVSVA